MRMCIYISPTDTDFTTAVIFVSTVSLGKVNGVYYIIIIIIKFSTHLYSNVGQNEMFYARILNRIDYCFLELAERHALFLHYYWAETTKKICLIMKGNSAMKGWPQSRDYSSKYLAFNSFEKSNRFKMAVNNWIFYWLVSHSFLTLWW